MDDKKPNRRETNTGKLVFLKWIFLIFIFLEVQTFYDCIFEDVLVSTIFKLHRELAIGRLTGVVEEDDNNILPISLTNAETHYDIFEYEATNSKRSVECKCFICQRNIAAVRFAPHLEKCIGIGRNSRLKNFVLKKNFLIKVLNTYSRACADYKIFKNYLKSDF